MTATAHPFRRIERRLQTLLAIGLAGACLAAASSTPAARGGRGADMASIVVHVVDRDGRPIAGLGTGDFDMTIDGRRRPLDAVDYVSLDPPAQGHGGAAADSGESAWTPPGRLFVLVVDQGHLRSGGQRSLLAAASAFLDRLQPADRVAVFSIPPGRANLPPTTDRVKVRGAFDAVVGQARRGVTPVNVGLGDALALEDGDSLRWDGLLQRECDDRVSDETLRAQCRQSLDQGAREILANARQASAQTLQGLAQVFEWLSDVEGPKSVLLLGEGLVTGTARSRAAVADPQRLSEVAAGSGASFYALQLQGRLFETGERGGAGGRDEEDLRRMGLDMLATQLRGALLTVSSPADPSLARVASETSAYYLLRFEAGRGERDGRARRFELKVRHAGAIVRARDPIALRPLPTASPEKQLLDALQSPVPARELPVALTTYTVRRGEGAARVLVAAGVDRGVKGPREIRTALLVLTPAGAVTAHTVDEQTLQVAGGGDEAHLLYTVSWDAAPGSYIVKFAALDRDGRIGVAERQVTAGLPGGAAADTSDLMLFDGPFSTSPAADGVMAAATLRLQIELYPAAFADAAVTFEILDARALEPLRSGEATLSRSEDTSRFVADGQIGLGDLPPGEYLARATVSRPGAAPVVVVSRRFRRPAAVLAAAASPRGSAARHGAVAPTVLGRNEVLERGWAYVDRYVGALSTVVCEEQYEQNLRRQTTSGLGIARSIESERRKIVSDLVFVRLPGAAEWSTFRDVYSVDGKPVRDREDRLLELFVKPRVDRWQQLQRIRDESSRHNIGGAFRDINIPTFALQFLLSGVRSHFVFEPHGRERVDGVETEVFAYREIGRPTAIRGRYNEDIPAFGQVWIEPVGGAIVRIRLETRLPNGQSRIDVSFQRNEKLGMWLPAAMEERHAFAGESISGRAEYSNFRQFTVETTEQVK